MSFMSIADLNDSAINHINSNTKQTNQIKNTIISKNKIY